MIQVRLTKLEGISSSIKQKCDRCFAIQSEKAKAVVTRIRLRFDFHATAVRPRYDHSTTYVTTVGLAVCGLLHSDLNKLSGRPPQYAPAPCKLTFDLFTLKVVSESHVTWATSVPILVFLGLSVLELGPMYATDRRQTRASSLNAPYPRGGGIIKHRSA